MALVQTEAIVLRTYNLAEADRIVLCLTRSAGLVRGVARGARRMKSRFGGALEPFTVIALTFYEKENRELVSLSQTEILKSYFDLASDPAAGGALAYMSELLVEFAAPHEADERLFRMVSASLSAIGDSPDDVQPVLRYFEMWLLRLSGFLPDYQSCSECRAPLDGAGIYINAEARPRCYQCSRGAGTLVINETRESMSATQKLSPLEFARASRSLTAAAREQFADLTHRLLLGVLEKRPRTSGSWFPPEVNAAANRQSR